MFLDIASAFDTAWCPAIFNSLLMKKCPIYLVKIIKSYLKNRSAVLRTGKMRKVRSVLLSCPQGGVLSSFLSNTLIEDIISTIFPFPCQVTAYADDIALLVTDLNPKLVTRRLQEMCNIIIEKLKESS